MFDSLNVLMVCKEDKATSIQRQIAFREIGCNLDVIYSFLLNKKVNLLQKLIWAIKFRLGYFPEKNKENAQIRIAIDSKFYDVVFIEKGLSIRPYTLKYIKSKSPDSIIISYTLDDMLNPHNSSVYYRKSLALYDFNFTNKRYNVQELRNLGAKNVIYFKNAFSPEVHRPVTVDIHEREYFGSDVSFVGTYESERAEALMYLAKNGLKIKVWGWGKDTFKSRIYHPNIQNMNKYVYGDEYAKVISSSKINLCFLRKVNRDRETTRSVEIPAMGGFMLAERTAEHIEMFPEGVGAEYFSNKEELLMKVSYYLQNEQKRIAIGINGSKICINSKLSYNEQLTNILLKTLPKKKRDESFKENNFSKK